MVNYRGKQTFNFPRNVHDEKSDIAMVSSSARCVSNLVRRYKSRPRYFIRACRLSTARRHAPIDDKTARANGWPELGRSFLSAARIYGTEKRRRERGGRKGRERDRPPRRSSSLLFGRIALFNAGHRSAMLKCSVHLHPFVPRGGPRSRVEMFCRPVREHDGISLRAEPSG